MKRYPSSILATCVIPWQADFRFDEALLRAEIRLLRDHLTRRLYLFGTAGEGYAVSDRQFNEIVSVFCEEMSGPEDVPMVGVISQSLPTILERIESCISRGIRDFQISFPAWGALTDKEVDCFFEQTCGRFPECRFLHYNLPRAKRVLVAADYVRLSAAHPNLVAVKFGGTDYAAQQAMLEQAPELQYYFTEFGYAHARDQFECGLLLSLGMVNFARAQEFFHARGTRLTMFHKHWEEVVIALKQAVGDSAHMDGAFDKLLLKTQIPQFPLRLLPPYASPPETCLQAFLDHLPMCLPNELQFS